MGVLKNARGHFRHAAELARERPFGARAVAQDAAEHFRAGSGARDLLDLGLAIDRKQPDAKRIGARDVPLLLDRVAVAQALGRAAGGQNLLDLHDGSRVEAGAKARQQVEHFRLRVRLHGVKYARVRQSPGERGVIVANDVEIDDKARTIVAAFFTASAQKIHNAIGHRGIPQGTALRRTKRPNMGWANVNAAAPLWRRRRAKYVRPGPRRLRRTVGDEQCDPVQRRRTRTTPKTSASAHAIRVSVAIDWKGKTLSARPARETSLFGTPTFGGVDRDEKARSVVALSRVPRLAGFAGSLRLPAFNDG